MKILNKIFGKKKKQMKTWRKYEITPLKFFSPYMRKVKTKNKTSLAYCERAVKDGYGKLVESWN